MIVDVIRQKKLLLLERLQNSIYFQGNLNAYFNVTY